MFQTSLGIDRNLHDGSDLACIRNIKKGKHTIEFKLFGNRHNTFGALHNCSINKWVGPDYWYTKDDTWCYEYNTKETGILKSPVITMYTNKGM